MLLVAVLDSKIFRAFSASVCELLIAILAISLVSVSMLQCLIVILLNARRPEALIKVVNMSLEAKGLGDKK